MRIKMVFAYDGHNFFGFQRQPQGRTIQGEIEAVLSKIFNEQTLIIASGRTDIGVHALAQVAHFDVNKDVEDLGKLRYSLNRLLPKDIHINTLSFVSVDFHARASAISKTYRYILSMAEANPFYENYRHELKLQLDIEKMKEAATSFLGKHFYRNFCTKEETDLQEYIREIYRFDVKNDQDIVTFEVEGSGFMRHMVRMMVGALVAIGLGKEKVDFISQTLLAPVHPINYKVPGCGLYLVEVHYKEGENYDSI